jgi:hypothetical protein
MAVIADLLSKIVRNVRKRDVSVPTWNTYIPSLREPPTAEYTHISFVIKDFQSFIVSGHAMAGKLLIWRT